MEQGVPDEVLEALMELSRQDKLSILWDGEEIDALFFNRGLKKRDKPFRPNAIVLVDAENIRLSRDLPRHIFIGEAIKDQLTATGFVIRDIFAFINNKGMYTGETTPAEIISQATTLFRQGLIPILCPYLGNDVDPSPDDTMIERIVHFCYGLPNDMLRVENTFAFVSTEQGSTSKKITSPEGIIKQATDFFHQGLIPILCPPYSDKKRQYAKDRMLDRMRRFCHDDREALETFVIVSGDSDFDEIGQDISRKGYDFRVLAPSSNINPEWRERIGATTLELRKEDQEAYDFLERYLKSLHGAGSLVQVDTQEEDDAVAFLEEVAKQIKSVGSHKDHNAFCNTVWKKLPRAWYDMYTRDFLFKLVQLIRSYTDIIDEKPTFWSGGPGTGFAYNSNSQTMWLLEAVVEA